ncbi:MAG: riboflavin biosynthesis protein RibF [Proteobacteria bacterium]|nr:riboflavin biosynthesis protein RibF [Pseudomonadota bacterium]
MLTIGNFDGVHLGHSQIISQVKKIAKEKNLASAILTFEPHPIYFLRPEKPRDFRITSLAQKLEIFRQQEIDYVIILPFNQNFSEISAHDFAQKILSETLNAKHLVIGYDFTFGKNRQGNFRFLENFNFGLSEISPLKNSEQTCSSSLVRKFLCEGKIAEANQVLGRNFTIHGVVNEGRKLASQLGFPTANLIAKPHVIKPKFGVYKTQTFIPHLKKKFSSITNFGIKPTLQQSQNEPLFETHIADFSEEIYGKKIHVEFLSFIREEKKFSSLEELKIQIRRDLAQLDSNFFPQ